MSDLDGTRRFAIRKPYGTVEGDVWLAGEDNPIQRKLDAEFDDGRKLIHEVMYKEGKLEECLYVTADPELLAAARRGTERYWAQKASEN